MIVVAAGSGSRFAGDKMLAAVAGTPLVALTVARVRESVDQCVVVCRQEHLDEMRRLDMSVDLAIGGPTRTASEMSGLAAVKGSPELIAIHDGARPNPSLDLIERLFVEAGRVGGAIPVVPGPTLLVDSDTLRPVPGMLAAQTPQVFDGPTLIECYRRAESSRFVGQDTLDVVSRFSSLPVAAVPGEASNLKVTYPGDLERVTTS
jgi:2-C-methyl-D-erythritol 4-phosphate cytidylyltransferase